MPRDKIDFILTRLCRDKPGHPPGNLSPSLADSLWASPGRFSLDHRTEHGPGYPLPELLRKCHCFDSPRNEQQYLAGFGKQRDDLNGI
jgi:hypothetical protein